MRRRVIKQGNNTLTITLPRKWTEQRNIKAGDELDVQESKSALMVQPAGTRDTKTITIEIPKGAKFYRRFIHAPYVRGYDEIHVVYHDEDIANKISQSMDLLIGFELVEQREKSVTLLNVAREIDEEFDHMFSRLMHVTAHMMETTAQSLATNDLARLDGIPAMETLANRLYLFCKRVLNRTARDLSEITSLYRVNCAFEEITDYLFDIRVAVLDAKKPVDKRIVAVMQRLHGQLKALHETVRKHDLAAMSKIADVEKDVEKELTVIARTAKPHEVRILMSLSSIVESIHAISEETY